MNEFENISIDCLFVWLIDWLLLQDRILEMKRKAAEREAEIKENEEIEKEGIRDRLGGLLTEETLEQINITPGENQPIKGGETIHVFFFISISSFWFNEL